MIGLLSFRTRDFTDGTSKTLLPGEAIPRSDGNFSGREVHDAVNRRQKY